MACVVPGCDGKLDVRADASQSGGAGLDHEGQQTNRESERTQCPGHERKVIRDR